MALLLPLDHTRSVLPLPLAVLALAEQAYPLLDADTTLEAPSVSEPPAANVTVEPCTLSLTLMLLPLTHSTPHKDPEHDTAVWDMFISPLAIPVIVHRAPVHDTLPPSSAIVPSLLMPSEQSVGLQVILAPVVSDTWLDACIVVDVFVAVTVPLTDTFDPDTNTDAAPIVPAIDILVSSHV